MTRLAGPGRPDWPRRGPLTGRELVDLIDLHASYHEARARLPDLFAMLDGADLPTLRREALASPEPVTFRPDARDHVHGLWRQIAQADRDRARLGTSGVPSDVDPPDAAR